ncbi:GntR family transcriptional regulator [Aerococcus urinaeequi]|uniref:GntR family transcriptional regulator n=1 Tax=Aerococcus sp. HMSC10H05 TaxID=1581084 RepID=UPI0008A37E59|nr:GntR family transcriptional regulator [Aerococcus sp. HMSC10H05]OFU53240.1 GntR family transcriptional regulator [Aerococcus sp. HMSC10H05]
MVEFDKQTPIYIQLADHYKREIVANRLVTGDKLPSRRDIAKSFKINPNTVQRAFKSLEEEGIIVSEANVPSKVTENQAIIQQLKQETLEQAMAVFYDTTQVLNMDPQEIANYMTAYFQKRGEQER